MNQYGNTQINGPITVAGKTTYYVPIIGMPTTSGIGPATCKSVLSFDVDTTKGTGANFIAQIGVTNPSQNNIPMWPWLGVMHLEDPGSNIVLPAGYKLRQTIERLDVVDPLQSSVVGYLPIPWYWTMNKGISNPSQYPQLEALITNNSNNALVILNIQFEATAY